MYDDNLRTTACCAQAVHDAIKSCPVRWAAEVSPIGEMDDGDGNMLELGNHRACSSTLAREAA
jgi:hypothetical protein